MTEAERAELVLLREAFSEAVAEDPEDSGAADMARLIELERMDATGACVKKAREIAKNFHQQASRALDQTFKDHYAAMRDSADYVASQLAEEL